MGTYSNRIGKVRFLPGYLRKFNPEGLFVSTVVVKCILWPTGKRVPIPGTEASETSIPSVIPLGVTVPTIYTYQRIVHVVQDKLEGSITRHLILPFHGG